MAIAHLLKLTALSRIKKLKLTTLRSPGQVYLTRHNRPVNELWGGPGEEGFCRRDD